MKRICFFVGYDKFGIISDYVIYYIEAMSKLSDVYYFADCEMKQGELAKLAPFVKAAYAKRHKKYDFGSWQELIRIIWLENLQKYDEFIFVNDSCFGPLFPLEPLFKVCSADDSIDIWSMFSLASFFWVLKKKAFFHPDFQSFIEGVKEEKEKEDVITKYEYKLGPLFEKAGLKYKTFSPLDGGINPYNTWRAFIAFKFPLLKLRVFTEKNKYHHNDSLVGWEDFLKHHTQYDTSLIKNYLTSHNIDPQTFETFGFKIRSIIWAIRRKRIKLFRIYLSKRHKIVVLFGKTIIMKPETKPTLSFYNDIKFD